MGKTPIRMVCYGWDHLQPLISGDVQPEGIDLTMIRESGLRRIYTDPAIDMSEMSLSHYLIRLSRGEREFIGLPVFPMRSFRHRCFYVARDSALQDFPDLIGKRVGTDAWPNTGNTWCRAAIRERGVDIGAITWVVGPVEEIGPPQSGAPAIDYPANVSTAPEGKTLVGMLLAGELDALMVPWPPQGFFTPESRFRHLIRDFRTAEQEYFRRVGYCPGIHVVAMRRMVFERDPSLAPRLVAAFEESKRRWREDRRMLADTTPWVLAELEETAALLGEDWQPYGVAPNRTMLAAFCQEQSAQGLVAEPLNPESAFADYEGAIDSR